MSNLLNLKKDFETLAPKKTFNGWYGYIVINIWLLSVYGTNIFQHVVLLLFYSIDYPCLQTAPTTWTSWAASCKLWYISGLSGPQNQATEYKPDECLDDTYKIVMVYHQILQEYIMILSLQIFYYKKITRS